jgi:hypothetical protein
VGSLQHPHHLHHQWEGSSGGGTLTDRQTIRFPSVSPERISPEVAKATQMTYLDALHARFGAFNTYFGFSIFFVKSPCLRMRMSPSMLQMLRWPFPQVTRMLCRFS